MTRLWLEWLEDRTLLSKTTLWTGMNSSSWSDNGNWSNGIPGQGDTAIFNNMAIRSTSTVDSAFSIARLDINWSGTITVNMSDSLTLTGDTQGGAGEWDRGFITGPGPIHLHPTMGSGRLTLNVGGTVTLQSSGQLIFDDAPPNIYSLVAVSPVSTFTNAGTVRGNGYFLPGGTVVNNGWMGSDSPVLFGLENSTVTNYGTLAATNGGELFISSTVTNIDPQAQISVDGSGSELVNAGLINGGTIALSNGSTLVNGDCDHGPGTITGSTFDATGGSTLTGNNGTLNGIIIRADSDLKFVGSTNRDCIENSQTLAGTITDGGTLEVQPTTDRMYLYVHGNVTVQGNGSLVFDNAGPGLYTLVQVFAGVTFTNAAGHTVRGNGYFLGEGTVVNDGWMGSDSPTVLFGLENSLVTNYGALWAANDGELFIGQNTRLDNQGTLEVNAAQALVNGPVIQVSGASLTGGTWSVLGASTLNLALAGTLSSNSGNVTLSGPGSTFAQINTLTSNAGSFGILNGRNFTAATLSNAGTLTVGAGSTITVNGDYTQTLNGTLDVELGDPASGQFGQLKVTGHVTLAGTLDATTLLGGFLPNPGDTFRVLTFGSRTGDFTTKNLYRDDTVALTTHYTDTTPGFLDLLTVPAPQHGSPGQPVPVSGQPFPTAPDIGPSIVPAQATPDGEGAGSPMPTARGAVPGARQGVEQLDSLFWLWAERPEADAALDVLAAQALSGGS